MVLKRLAGAMLALALIPGAARAQQAAAQAADTPASPERPPLAATAAPQPPQPAPLQAVSGPFRSLYDRGVLLSAYLYDDWQGDPVGGLKQGDANAGAGTLGLDADLERFAGIPGGRFHLLFTYEYGDTLQRDIGNFIKSQDWFLPGQKFQLAELAYEQSLFGDRLNVIGGRVSAATLFARPTYGCNFISGSQCPYYLPVFTGGFSGYPYATWGGRVRVNTTPNTYVQAGGFAVDPGRRFAGGFQLGLNTTTGVAVPVEAGYESDFSNDRYPRHYRIGAWYNDAPSIDPFLNAERLPRALNGGAPLTNTFGRGGAYLLADQVVYRPDASRRNLAVFASLAAPFNQREIFSAQNTAGVYATGPLASRPYDTLGFMVTQALFTRAETAFENQLLAKNGSHTFVQRDQFDVEVNYGYQVAPGMVVTPNAEYIFHPDVTQRPDATFAPKNALVLGVRLTLSLTDALGLPGALPKLH
jgi:porin